MGRGFASQGIMALMDRPLPDFRIAALCRPTFSDSGTDLMSTAMDKDQTPPAAEGGFKPRFRWGIIGSAAPVFPGFEVDILDRVPDGEKPDAVWHRDRGRAILKAHPEVRELFGPAPITAVCCVAVAGLQLGLAVMSGWLPWWGALLIAYVFGAPINVMLFQLAHECDHGLVFKKSSWNRYLFTVTSLPMFLWAHHTWWIEHLTHHSDMGATKDFITRRRSFFLISRKMSPLFFPYSLTMVVLQCLRSVIGLVMYLFTSLLRGRIRPTDATLAVLADEHLVSGYRQSRIGAWGAAYAASALLMTVLLFVFIGWHSLLYLLMSQVFFTGFLHPYCLGWVLGISHFHGRKNYQPTASHYGWFVNLTSFNAGLHVEHHDLAAIPWFRMWKLRAMAPEFYETLQTIPSYTALAMKFVFAKPKAFDDNFNTETYRNLERFSERVA